MIPINKYLIEATISFISDNLWTPYISVNALKNNKIDVPTEYISDEGLIVFDISPNAILGLEITDQAIIFNGKFKGVNREIYIPIDAVIAVFAHENKMGLALPVIEAPKSIKPLGKEKPTLKLVEK
jgi:stringent starvation protein B